MATKTFRTIYLYDDLDRRLLMLAEEEKISASRLVRDALEQFLAKKGMHSTGTESPRSQPITTM